MTQIPQMLGSDAEVACVDGRTLRYANLDHAASTPVMADVWAAVEEFLPWYSSVHRGSGHKSQLSTAEFEGARDDDRLDRLEREVAELRAQVAALREELGS